MKFKLKCPSPDRVLTKSSLINFNIIQYTSPIMFNMIRKNDASPGCCFPPPGHLIKPRHNLKLIARQMEEKRPRWW